MERNSGDARRKDRERIMVQEGIELWKLKKQEQQAHKIQEQREVRRTYIYMCVCADLLRDKMAVFCLGGTRLEPGTSKTLVVPLLVRPYTVRCL